MTYRSARRRCARRRKGDRRPRCSRIKAISGCFPQRSGGGIAVGGLAGASGECYLSWMVPKRRTALQQNHFGTVGGVVEKYENSRLSVSDTCRNRVVGVELARCGGAERGNESNKSAGNSGCVILWSGRGQPIRPRCTSAGRTDRHTCRQAVLDRIEGANRDPAQISSPRWPPAVRAGSGRQGGSRCSAAQSGKRVTPW